MARIDGQGIHPEWAIVPFGSLAELRSVRPSLWMFGQIEPLMELQGAETRAPVIERILTAYPENSLSPGQILYRARLNAKTPNDRAEYDGQPLSYAGNGRLDSSGFPTLYASQDLQVCMHECRATAEDEI